jgi:hypothetical protein
MSLPYPLLQVDRSGVPDLADKHKGHPVNLNFRTTPQFFSMNMAQILSKQF